jgi:hypothetical protein
MSMSVGYSANTSKRRFDPFYGAHPIDKNRLLTDRSAYISFLEVQLERVTSSCLTVQGFSDRIDQIQHQLNALQDKVNQNSRLGIQTGNQLNTNTAASTTTAEMENLVSRVAEDTMEAIQAMHKRIADLEKRNMEKIEEAKKEAENKLVESNSKITGLLKKLVQAQKQMQLKVSGDVQLTMNERVEDQPKQLPRPYSGLEPSFSVGGGGGKSRASSVPVVGSSRKAGRLGEVGEIKTVRRRKAMEDLFQELELLEKEQAKFSRN